MGAVVDAVQWRESTLAEERQRRTAAIDTFVRRLTAEVKPTCIVLFGSVAKGTDRVDSDIDLVVIGGNLPEEVFDRLDALARLKRGLPVSIDAFPYTTAEFESMLDNLHVTALDCLYEGIPLQGKGYFDRLRPKFDEFVKRGLQRDNVAWHFAKKAA